MSGSEIVRSTNRWFFRSREHGGSLMIDGNDTFGDDVTFVPVGVVVIGMIAFLCELGKSRSIVVVVLRRRRDRA